MAMVIYTCPRCGAVLIDTVICTTNGHSSSSLIQYPPKVQKLCPSCGWTYTEDHEEVIRVPFGGNLGNGAFCDASCLRCPTNPANGGDGICFCTLGGPRITW